MKHIGKTTSVANINSDYDTHHQENQEGNPAYQYQEHYLEQ